MYDSKTRRMRCRRGGSRSGRRRRLLSSQPRDEDVDQKDVGQDAGGDYYHLSHVTKMSIKRMSVRTPAATTIPCQPREEDVDQKDCGQDAGGT